MPARAGLLAALALASTLGNAAVAQEVPPAVVVIDQERLFHESLFGQRVATEVEERSETLAAENRAIEAELIAEERELTERRSELPPDEFRGLADAFDRKVERLRAEQDAKTRELVSIREAGRQNFTRSVGPILLEFMGQSGASVMLDRRSVVVTADRVDVTDELIAEIDERVGAGELSVELPEAPPSENQRVQTQPQEPRPEEPLSMPEVGNRPLSPSAAEQRRMPGATE